MDIDIDARNLNCPMPVIKTKKALESIETGNVHVLIERLEGCQNVRRFAESQGCDVGVKEKEGLFHIHIKKKKQNRTDFKEQSGGVVLITADVL
jgi:TusA-related sulfurtransferase